jgi:phospholipid transport system substrate-binding protein
MTPVMRRSFLLGAAVAAVLCGAGGGESARAAAAPPGVDSPTATIQAFYDALLAVMKAAKQMTFDERYTRLQPAITRAFDLGLMTRIAIGPAWTRLPQSQQEQLAASFARWTISTYANRFDSYSGERFEVDPNPVSNPNGLIVETRLERPTAEPVALNYLMRRNGAGLWQIIDVFLSGTVSELATRRSEFVAVLQRDGADGLVRLLDRRAQALRTG